jgi:hypothetical protein
MSTASFEFFGTSEDPSDYAEIPPLEIFPAEGSAAEDFLTQEIPVQDFPAEEIPTHEIPNEEEFIEGAPPFVSADPDLWLYRDRTRALLRRYFRLSIEVGRLPSLLGREFFRTKVTSYRVGTFEDAVIFVHDVERCLDKLNGFERTLIGRVVLQDFSHDEASHLMGCWRRTVGRRLPEALDHLSEIFLEAAMLSRLPARELRELQKEKSCQEAKPDEIELSDGE